MAIGGLEKRLIRTFDTMGGYGVFLQYLDRSLLWRRKEQAWLTPIEYFTARTVPSWSWMANEGAIEYPRVEFGGGSTSQ